ncbi:E4 control protein orf2 [Human mastadenovirus B]|uniref:E4 control protein orf2 n=1 Tax=Human mastadenovirus B TaxID=108098 RepID=T2CHU9_9ADEN|nr:E4 control protein orf2 [Human mastadenovirus B]
MLERSAVTYCICIPELLNVHLAEFSFINFIRETLPDYVSSTLDDITGGSQYAYCNLTFAGSHWGGLRLFCTVASPALIPGGPMAKQFGDDLKEFLQLELREELRANGMSFDVAILNLLQVTQEQDILSL